MLCNRALIRTGHPPLSAFCFGNGTDDSRTPLVTARCSWIEIALGVKNPAGPLHRVPQSLSGSSFFGNSVGSHAMGRGLLLWMLGIPIPVVILLYVFHVI
jgi:hypothetical protein